MSWKHPEVNLLPLRLLNAPLCKFNTQECSHKLFRLFFSSDIMHGYPTAPYFRGGFF